MRLFALELNKYPLSIRSDFPVACFDMPRTQCQKGAMLRQRATEPKAGQRGGKKTGGTCRMRYQCATWYQKMSHVVSKIEPSGIFLSRISVATIFINESKKPAF